MKNENNQIGFGDTVKVRATPLTEELGLAGLVGQVYGETTPSVTNVEVIGSLSDDYAINVQVNERDETCWFAPDLLEFVDHAAGTEMVVGNAKAVRREDGSWEETVIKSEKKPWWKFW